MKSNLWNVYEVVYKYDILDVHKFNPEMVLKPR